MEDKKPEITDEAIETLNLDESNPFEETMISEKKAFVEDWDKETHDKENNLKSEEVNAPVKKKKKSKKWLLFIFIILILLAALAVFGYFFYYGNSKKLIGTSLNDVSAKFDKVLSKNKSNIDVGNTSTITSDIIFDIEGSLMDTLEKNAGNGMGDLIKNLEELKGRLVINRDVTNKKLLSKLNVNFKNQPLIDASYFIDNNKEYYFVKDLSDQYIENNKKIGINVNTTKNKLIDDAKYLNKFVEDSFVKHVDDKYFSKKSVKTTIDGSKKSVTKVTLKIDNKAAIKIFNAVLKDLKNDAKALKIFESMNIKIENFKLAENEEIFINPLEYNSYVDKITFKEYKKELVYNGMKLVYEDSNPDIIEVYVFDQLIGSAKISKKDKNVDITISDAENKKIGTINLESNKDKLTIDGNLNISGVKIDIDISNENKEISANDKYYSNTKFVVEASADNTTLLKLSSTIDSTIVSGAEFDVDISNAVSSSKIKEDQYDKILKQFNTSAEKAAK